MTDLRQSYALCGRVARRHGKTYAMAARLLPPEDRRHVHAVYAFCRVADDIVDDPGNRTARETSDALVELGDRFLTDLASGRSSHPLLAAVVHTARTLPIDADCFRRFLRAMSMDLTVSSYATWDDLLGYMDGSAAVIGEMMLPVLRPWDHAAFEPARQLGLAFQFTNFLRDVGEDLDRGRVYIPEEDLRWFDADPSRRQVTPQWQALMEFEIARTRTIYARADEGIAMLPPRSAACVRAARVLYARLLDRIVAADYDVFTARARVPGWEKVTVAARCLLRPGPAATTTRGSMS